MYKIGSYVIYPEPYKAPTWENIWKVVGHKITSTSKTYILENKVGGVLSEFEESEIYASPAQNPAMIFDKYKFAWAQGAAGVDYKQVKIDLIEWGAQYHETAVGFEKGEELKIWNEDSNCFVKIKPEWCYWSFEGRM